MRVLLIALALRKKGFDSAEEFDKAREEVENGNIPKEVQAAVNTCQAQQ